MLPQSNQRVFLLALRSSFLPKVLKEVYRLELTKFWSASKKRMVQNNRNNKLTLLLRRF